MDKFGRYMAVRFIKLVDVAVMTAFFGVCWFVYYANRVFVPFYLWGNRFVVGFYCLVFIILGKIYDAFLVSHMRISEMVYSQALSLFLADGFFYAVSCLLARRLVSPIPMLLTLLCQLVAASLWCYGAHRLYFSIFPPKRTAVVYDCRENLEKVIEQNNGNKKFKVEACIRARDCLADLTRLDGMEVVFFSGVHSSERNIILKYCFERGILCYVLPRIGDVLMHSGRQMHLFHLTFFRIDGYKPSVIYLAVKRFADIVLSLTAFVLLSPVFAVTAIAVKLCDGGPIFYTQDRLTKGGKVFTMHKFRSMSVDVEQDGVARLSTGKNDSRITPVGRVIRRLRIDELPQLWDVLTGNLSIVGPRPERPEIAAQYERELPEFRLRLQAKAGLTGYAQVYGQYNTAPYDKLQMDLLYIANPSILEDLRICFATVKILFMPESTEGIAIGSTTAMDEKDRAK